MESAFPLIQLCNGSESEETAGELLRFLNTNENLDLDVNGRDSNGRTPIILVTMRCHPNYLRPVLERLLERGADVNAVDEDSWNCLMFLCRFYSGPDLKDLVDLLVSKRIDINATTRDGWNCLMLLCRNYSGPHLKDLVELLVSKRIDINATEEDGWNCLMFLCRFYSGPDLKDLVELLVSKEIDIKATSKKGSNCLMFLCRHYSGPDLKDLVELLVSKGIDINATNKEGSNCLMFLCGNYSGPDLKYLVELLVSKGIDINATNENGWNCLMLLCRYYSGPHLKDLVDLLLSKGIDINATKERISVLITVSRMNCMDNCVSDLVNVLCPNIPRDYPAEEFNKLLYFLARSGCWKSMKQIAQCADCLYQDASGLSAASFLQELRRGSLVSLCSCCRNQVNLKEFEALIESLKQKTPKKLPDGGEFSRKMFDWGVLPDTDSTFAQWREQRKLPTNISQGLENLQRNLSFSRLKDYVDKDLTQNENWQKVITAVQQYVTSLVKEAAKLDRCFEGRLVHYGSSSEKTKLLLPDEFDYLLDLKHFRPDQEDTKSILYTGEESIEEFYSENTLRGGKKRICSWRMLYYFGELLLKAGDYVPSRGVILIQSALNKTCVTLDLIFRGKLFDEPHEPFQVSVDITLGVRSQDTLPDDLPKWCSLSGDEAQDSRVYLVSDRMQNESYNWKESYPCLERDSILRGGPVVQRCLRMLKLLVALNNWELDDRDTQPPTKTHPSSYAIKTCALQYMKQNPPPWDDSDLLKHCLGICEILSEPSPDIDSFFCSKVAYYKTRSHHLTMERIKHQLGEWSRSEENFQL